MTKTFPVFALIALVLTAAPAGAERLPLLAVPEHYTLRFVPDLAAERFEGRATIRLRVLAPTRKIVLHAADLSISAARVTAGPVEQAAVVSLDPSSETATFYVPVDLKPGPAELHVEYRGVLNRELRGFYISEANGRKYAVTQLEATDARRMFPSFDEPHYKATFDVSVIVDERDNAISNGAVTSVRPGPGAGVKTIEFETTARMSSYLVALAIGDFECAADEVGATPVRVCATPGKEPLTRFAMDATRASLEYFNRYFALDYPFGKLDLVAIPDFAAGAMENTGAVFFRESLLLVADDASRAARKRAALVIAHELAHHWFGNLVTMRWWDDLWLNEGFATWMETKAIAAWQPGWNVDLDERQAVQSAMAVDALVSTRPVRMRAETPAEINELFDPIAYEKGAAVLGMVEAFVGEEAFRGGVNAYLHEHKYDNATAEDFWGLMTRATGAPVDRVMRSFIDRPGVPLVTVDTACEQGRTVVTLAQERFLTSAAGAQQTGAWAIPVCFETRGDADADRCELLDETRETVRLPGCARWVVANANANGYYRTEYSKAAVSRLATANASLGPEERLVILSDSWALVRAGRSDVGSFLNLAASLASDLEAPATLDTVAARLQFVHEYIAGPGTRDAFEQWVRSEFAPALSAAAYGTVLDGAARDDRMRALLLTIVGGIGRDPAVLAKALREVETDLARPSSPGLSATVLNAIVPLAATIGDADLYQKYRARAESAATPEDRYRFLHALAAFRNPELLRRTMEYALSPRVRTQDRAALVSALLGNPAGREIAWRILQDRWLELQEGLGAFGGAARIVGALGNFCDRRHLADIQAFFETHPVEDAERTLRQALEDIEHCAGLVESQAGRLDAWLGTSTR